MDEKVKHKLKNLRIKIKNIPKKIWSLILSVDMDFIFLFLASYFFNYSYPWYYRIIGAVGVVYIYKVVVKDIIRITIMKNK